MPRKNVRPRHRAAPRPLKARGKNLTFKQWVLFATFYASVVAGLAGTVTLFAMGGRALDMRITRVATESRAFEDRVVRVVKDHFECMERVR